MKKKEIKTLKDLMAQKRKDKRALIRKKLFKIGETTGRRTNVNLMLFRMRLLRYSIYGENVKEAALFYELGLEIFKIFSLPARIKIALEQLSQGMYEFNQRKIKYEKEKTKDLVKSEGK